MAKIDILLPYWGEFTLFKQAVGSVLAQTETDWNLLIFEDHYPSLEASEYIKKLNDPRIKYHRHDKNLGITKNFNFAVEQAQSRYCSILGGDDVMLPSYIARALLMIGSADFYQPNVQPIDKNSQPYLPLVDRMKRYLRPKKQGVHSGEQLATSLCRGNWLYFPSIVWKTATIKNYPFDPQYKIVEDVVVELDMIIDGKTLYVDNTTTFQYRRFAESLSSKEKGKLGVRFKEEADVYDKFADKFKQIGWHQASRAARMRVISRINQAISR